MGYLQDADAFVRKYGYRVVGRAIKFGRAAEARGNSSGKPIKNLPGFIQHLVTSGAALRALELDAAGAKKRTRQVDERELVEVVKHAFDAYRNEMAEEVFRSLDEDTRHALPEVLRIELETQNRLYVLDILEKADWQGTQYQLARNNYLLDLYHDKLPAAVHDISAFLEVKQLLAEQPNEVAARVLNLLKEELTT